MMREVDLEAEAARALNEGKADDMICCCEPNCPLLGAGEDCWTKKFAERSYNETIGRVYSGNGELNWGRFYEKNNHLEDPSIQTFWRILVMACLESHSCDQWRATSN